MNAEDVNVSQGMIAETTFLGLWDTCGHIHLAVCTQICSVPHSMTNYSADVFFKHTPKLAV